VAFGSGAAMAAREKYVLADLLQEQKGRQARGRFLLLAGEIKPLAIKAAQLVFAPRQRLSCKCNFK
jgi:hypothetical protein